MDEYILYTGGHPAGLGGTQTVYKFDNGYGASVITGGLFYTDDKHPYELAVLKFDETDDDYEIDYTTPITSDVIGHLNGDKLYDVLTQIKALPTKENDNGNN